MGVSPSDRAGVSRRRFLQLAGVTGAGLLIPVQAFATSEATGQSVDGDGIVLRWNNAALQGVRDSKLGPPMVARALAIVHTAMYDAWAAYDRGALGTQFGAKLRRPPRERTFRHRSQAISFAAYRAAADLFPGSTASVFDPLMASLGYDPRDHSIDPATPVGVGNLTARAVLEFRHHDGSNQLGDEPGGDPGVPYSDFTGYLPVNRPMDVRKPLDLTTVVDANAWQPLTYVDSSGALVTPRFVGAQWNRVVPFGLKAASQLRSHNGPARVGTRQFLEQAEALIEISSRLTDEEKVIAEYWADGPHSELPPGHWDLFAQFVSRRDHRLGAERGLEREVKLFFLLTNAISDAAICAWDNKRAFNSVRPITAVRYLFYGRRIRAWGGPYLGTRLIRGEEWLPYQPSTFPTPPFPEYTSGHSTFSAAGAEILRLFTGDERFGASVVIPAGSSKVEPGATPAMDMMLKWPTLTDAADQAGISRRFGGIHFEQGDLDGRETGRQVARLCWDRAQALFEGDD